MWKSFGSHEFCLSSPLLLYFVPPLGYLTSQMRTPVIFVLFFSGFFAFFCFTFLFLSSSPRVRFPSSGYDCFRPQRDRDIGVKFEEMSQEGLTVLIPPFYCDRGCRLRRQERRPPPFHKDREITRLSFVLEFFFALSLRKEMMVQWPLRLPSLGENL